MHTHTHTHRCILRPKRVILLDHFFPCSMNSKKLHTVNASKKYLFYSMFKLLREMLIFLYWESALE